MGVLQEHTIREVLKLRTIESMTLLLDNLESKDLEGCGKLTLTPEAFVAVLEQKLNLSGCGDIEELHLPARPPPLFQRLQRILVEGLAVAVRDANRWKHDF